MREIKFKGWNIVTERMIDLEEMTPIALNMDIGGIYIPDSDGIKVLQYTGLKDKNGVEVYEGDIFITHNESYARQDQKLAVKFSHGAFVSYNPNCCDICKNGYGCISDLYEVTNFEVIGNIFQNPELLEASK